MVAFLPISVFLSLLVTGATAGGYGSPTTPSPSAPASYTPTPATPPPPPTATPPAPYTPQPATPPKPAHDYDDDKKLVVVHVEGLVVCQSCEKRGSPSLDGARPLPKAQVMVTCRDWKNRIMAHRLCAADTNGYFHAEFGVEPAHEYLDRNPLGACFVRLLSSPDPKCNIVTNIIHRGMEGAPVRDGGKHWIDGRGIKNVVHAAGPLAFRPATCAPPHHY